MAARQPTAQMPRGSPLCEPPAKTAAGAASLRRGTMALVSDGGFQHILRVLNTNVDGRQKVRRAPARCCGLCWPCAARLLAGCLTLRLPSAQVMFAITAIKGIGRRLANVACKKAEVDLSKRAGELSASELESLMVVVSNPRQFRVPDWFLNRCARHTGGGRTNPRAQGFGRLRPPPPVCLGLHARAAIRRQHVGTARLGDQ